MQLFGEKQLNLQKKMFCHLLRTNQNLTFKVKNSLFFLKQKYF